MVVVVRRRRRRPRPPLRLEANQLAFLDGLLDAYDELPDGAWEAACKEAIAESREFRMMDAHDVWISWLISRSRERQVL